MEAALVVSRFAQYSASMILLGTSLFLIQFERGRAVAPEVRCAFCYWQRPLLASAAAIAFVASLSWLDIEAGLMGGSWADAASLQTLSTVLFQTTFGRVWEWTSVAAAVLVFALAAPSGDRPTTRWTVLIAGFSAFMIASASSTGHAVMQSGIAGAVHVTVQGIHVLAASVWLGSLPALGFVLRMARPTGQAAWRDAARYILPRYSRMGYLAVGSIVLTGCLNSWFMLDSIDALFSTTYGRILVAKIGLLLLMVGVAIVNRFILTPLIVKPQPNTSEAAAAFRRLWRNVAIEQCFGLSIIAMASVLGTVAPVMSGQMEM